MNIDVEEDSDETNPRKRIRTVSNDRKRISKHANTHQQIHTKKQNKKERK